MYTLEDVSSVANFITAYEESQWNRDSHFLIRSVCFVSKGNLFDVYYYSTVEDSFNLAIDTGLDDIIVTGDFNFNLLSIQVSRKITSLCTEFALYQTIDVPTHFTDTSKLLIGLLFVHNKSSLTLSGVGDPFLGQEHRYHCPIYGAFKFCRPKLKSITCQIWSHDRCDFALLRAKSAETDWDSLWDDDLNITNHIPSIAKECIPNKPTDRPWITTAIKHYIKKRKRAYRTAKWTSVPALWNKFKGLLNKVVSLIRNSKSAHTKKIAEKLRSDSLSPKHWWSVLKSFISPASKSPLPPIEQNGTTYTDDQDKANLLNDFFRD